MHRLQSRPMWGCRRVKPIKGILDASFSQCFYSLSLPAQASLTARAITTQQSPPYDRQIFCKYLDCGFFAHSFPRARCEDLGQDYFVAFSCKGRGVCPSCNTGRMVEKAAHLSDHVFPRLSVRQWVLSVPTRLGYFLQRDGAVLNMALRIFLRVISQSLQSNNPGAAQVDKAALHIGAIAFIHRFRSSPNAHVHFHVCVVDGMLDEVAGKHWTPGSGHPRATD